MTDDRLTRALTAFIAWTLALTAAAVLVATGIAAIVWIWP